jgi:DNA-binding NarL/FixJ family response regulator
MTKAYARPVTQQLSPLSQKILVRFTNGEKIKTIASELGTTRDVVDGQLRRIYQHFRVKGIALLVHAAIREGWIKCPAVAPKSNIHWRVMSAL